tara:strand:+ start:2198 stop:2797 length:600 start_codon:yes stop_codon:yes gene_type:complete
MIDSVVLIVGCSLGWYETWKDMSVTGIPLLFLLFMIAFYNNMFPGNVYNYGIPSVAEIVSMTITTDFLQFLVHVGTHKKIFGKLVYDSHNIHHKEKNPQPKDAFSTGVLDAIVQLIIPLYISICMIDPNRCSVILFGLLYSQWLLFIHSDKEAFSTYLVSAEYHKKHHKKPDTNFSHIFPIWDLLYSQSLRVIERIKYC